MEVVVLSPRVMCPCGKGVVRMTPDQRKEYDDCIRRLEDRSQEKTISSIESTPSDTTHVNEYVATSDG